LRLQRLVATRRAGREVYYRVASPQVSEVLATLYRLYCDPAQETETRDEIAAAV
jgi:DNA-binding transcriptional ArsR family regulator